MPDIAGNTLGSATLLHLTASAQSFSDIVTSLADDYYRFNLSSRSSFSLSLTGLTADANVALLNGAGAPLSLNGSLQNSSNSGTFAESINTVLDAGVYYIRVFPSSTIISADYSLNLSISTNLQSDILWRNYTQWTGHRLVNEWHNL